MNLEACLPEHLRGELIVRASAGLSGAGVYRVGESFVLKISDGSAPIDDWRRRLALHRLAAEARVAPAIVHVDEAHRAVVSAFASGSFVPRYADPRTRDAAIAQLGRTLRRVHDLPIALPATDARAILAAMPIAGLPAFAGDAVQRMLAAPMPPGGAPVPSHNDVNPTNVVFAGDDLMLVDWDVAGGNDPYYDLAAIATFLRMDDDVCRALVAAHDGEPIAGALPPRFVYDRRFVATLCGVMMLRLSGLTSGDERVDAGPPDVRTPEGRWRYGVALLAAANA